MIMIIFSINRRLFLFFYTGVLLLGVTACEKPIPNGVNYISPKCISAQSTCVIEQNLGSFTFLFNVDEIVSETPFNIHIQYEGQYELVSAQGYIVGENMYMGKIPVLYTLDSNTNELVAQGLLGSCSEDVMSWKLHVNIELKDKTSLELKQESLVLYFDSIRA